MNQRCPPSSCNPWLGRLTGLSRLIESFWGDVGAIWPGYGAPFNEEPLAILRILQWLEDRPVQPLLEIDRLLQVVAESDVDPIATPILSIDDERWKVMVFPHSSGGIRSKGLPALICSQFVRSSRPCISAHSLMSRSAILERMLPTITWPVRSNFPC
jgi:hypothetical protein